MTGLSLKIAFRYLFARKSYNVINLISGIGVAGMAVGTAALVIVLSVFNGFNTLVADSLSDAGAPLVVRPAQGKVFVPEGPAFDWMLESEDITRLSSVLEESNKTLRGELGHVVAKQFRIVPELIFLLDTSLDYAEHIDQLLKK